MHPTYTLQESNFMQINKRYYLGKGLKVVSLLKKGLKVVSLFEERTQGCILV